MFWDLCTCPAPPDQKVRLWRHNVISEGIDMPMEQSNPDKGLLMIGAIAGGILLLVLLATFFGAI